MRQFETPHPALPFLRTRAARGPLPSLAGARGLAPEARQKRAPAVPGGCWGGVGILGVNGAVIKVVDSHGSINLGVLLKVLGVSARRGEQRGAHSGDSVESVEEHSMGDSGSH